MSSRNSRLNEPWAQIIAAIIAGIFVVIAAYVQGSRSGQERGEQQASATATAQQIQSAAAAEQPPLPTQPVAEAPGMVEVTPMANPETAPPAAANPAIEPVAIDIETARASSTFTSFRASLILDGNETYCWMSEPKEQPEGEWVEFTLREPRTITGIRIYNPEPHTSRMAETVVTFDNGSQQTVTFDDFGEWQEKPIQPVTTTSLKIDVINAYTGESNKHISICEAQLVGHPE